MPDTDDDHKTYEEYLGRQTNAAATGYHPTPIWGPPPPCPSCAETTARLREALRERAALKGERGEWADGQAALMGRVQDAEVEIARLAALLTEAPDA